MLMWVNPFWFGVLMTIVAIIVLFIVIGIVQAMRGDDEIEDKDDESQDH